MSAKNALQLTLTALTLAGCTTILGLDYDYRGASSTTTTSVATGGSGVSTGPGGQTTGTTSGSGGGPKCGTFVFDALPSCETCMENKCCVELNGCTAGSPCAALLACSDACDPGDDVCKNTCLTADEQAIGGIGAAAYYALLNCNYEKCRVDDACQFPICTTSFTTYDRACSECAGTKCCAAVKACDNSATCLACLENPNVSTCANNSAFLAITQCQTVTCGKECAFSICGSPDFGYPVSSCNDCLSQKCCGEFNECTQNPASSCYKCLSGAQPDDCGNDAKFVAFDACLNQKCKVACSGI